MWQVEAILPEDVYKDIQPSLNAKLENPKYARVFMSPSEILEHDFFNTYIKAGVYHLRDPSAVVVPSNLEALRDTRCLALPQRLV